MSDSEKALEALNESAPVGGDTVGDSGEGSVGTASPFFEYDFGDGDKRVFNKPAELADYLKDSSLRRKDYQQKLAAISGRGERLSKREREIENRAREWEEKIATHEKFDKFLRANPQVAQRIAAEMRGTGKNNSAIESLLEEKLKPLNEWKESIEQQRKREETERNRRESINRVKSRFPDWDDEAFSKEMNRLQGIPEQALPETMAELLYYAIKGKRNPAGEQQTAATKRQISRPGQTPPTTRVGSSGKDVTQMSRKEKDEAAIAALESLG